MRDKLHLVICYMASVSTNYASKITLQLHLRSPETCRLENTFTSPLLYFTLSTNATYFFRTRTSLALKKIGKINKY